MNRTFIHPGFGKSGTTTLQENLFNKHRDILSLGRPYTELNIQLYKQITNIEGLNFDKSICNSLIEQIVGNSMHSISADKCWVLSDETFVSNAYMRSTIASRLKDLFPNSQVIFTIRNQIKALESFYASHGHILQGVPAPYGGRYVSLENWLQFAYANKEITYLGLIDYFTTINLYEDIFGKDHIHIFLYEEFIRKKQDFLLKLSSILSISQAETLELLERKHDNPRQSNRILTYQRIRERLLPGLRISKMLPFGSIILGWFESYLKKGERIEVEIPPEWIEKLSDLYCKGNSELMKKGLPLNEYEYPL